MKLRTWIHIVVGLGLLLGPWPAAASLNQSAQAAPAATIWYVKPGAAGDCSSWTNACDLQTALGKATAGSGDEIWVAQGIYKPTPGNEVWLNFGLKSNVKLYGGFPGNGGAWEQRDPEAHVTVLSGDIDNNDITNANGVIENPANIKGNNSYHVVTGHGTTATAVLDGFTITGGNANGPYQYNEHLGGGMFNDSGSPTLTNVTFSGNSASYIGGGMANVANSSPTLAHVTFSSNAATLDSGGGMYNKGSSPTLTDVTFSRNTASSDGGGMHNTGYSSPTLTDVTFSDNTADYGSGMYNADGCEPKLKRVTFSGNVASYCGGGMFNRLSSPALTLSDVTFSGNRSGIWGGGMCNWTGSNPTLTDVTFSGNAASESGGGMYNVDLSEPTLRDVTFNGNTADLSGGGMFNDNSSPALTSVTFGGNTALNVGGGMANLNYSSPTLTDATFTGNSAGGGGGMWNENGPANLLNVIFLANAAATDGGGMVNSNNSTSTLTNVRFNGNKADSDGNGSGNGGGIYNLASSPVLTNVTLSANSAQHGGGMANVSSSTPGLINGIVWGNTAAGGSPQIYDDESSTVSLQVCMVEGGYSGCTVVDTASPFMDADGADNVPGDYDDDLRLVGTSNAIDAGDRDLLPNDSFDLDRDGDTTEKLPYDLDGNPRCYADNNLDGIVDGLPKLNQVDLGVYEAGRPAWHIHRGGELLSEGQKYRQGFHIDIGDTTTYTMTVGYTLDQYAAEQAAGNLSNALKAYELVLDYATTLTETHHALLGLENTTWELATGALLQGNEQMVQALDLTDSEDIAAEITGLEAAIKVYDEAVDGYLDLLTSGDFPGFLDSQPHRIDPLTGEENPYLDVQRLAAALAKRSRAKLELAERQFRQEHRDDAEQTLREARGQASVELTLLYDLWADVVDDVNYQALLRNMSDMDRLLGFLAEGKNALGYSPEWVPMHYNPTSPGNNYQQTDALAEERVGWATTDVGLAEEESEKVHDNYQLMHDRYNEIEGKYDEELVALCGVDEATNEPDLDRCGGGTIATQISAVEQAHLRLLRVLDQMNVLNKRIDIEVEARAKAAGIYAHTAELINPETSEKYSSLMNQQKELETGWKVAKGIGGILTGMVSGASSGNAFGPWGAVVGGLFGALSPGADMLGGLFGGGEGPSKTELLEEFQAWQNAQIVICDGQIKDVEFEKRIKELFLEFGGLDIDHAIALENLHQELLRLQGMTTRVEYLLAEKARAVAFTQLLYQDPAHRVLRDQYMEQAQDSYDAALSYVFQAGRALEYEANLTAQQLGAPDPDAALGVRNINTLRSRRQGTKAAYDDWVEDKVPQTRTTTVLLSRALGFEDTEIPGIGPVTAEEQFNAYVIRNPANRYGSAKSLYFTFGTSIHKDNPFFDYCFFNDRIKEVQMRVRGDVGKNALGENKATVRLGWGDVRCEETDCGTTFLRSEEAFKTPDGPGKYLDDLRAYKVRPKLAIFDAVTGDVPLGAANADLVTRSVHNPSWTFYIDMALPANAGLKLDNIDEIELVITHEAYTLQAGYCAGPGASSPAPYRAYRPMEKVLDPQSSPLLQALANDRRGIAAAEANDLNGFYAGTVVPSSPEYMPAIDLNLMLTAAAGGSRAAALSGYVDVTQGLHFPAVDETTGHGPALSGSWSGDGFSLHSDKPFTITLSSGLTVTRTLLLSSGVISNSGEILTGGYLETLTGLTPEPMEITGEFQLWRLPLALAPTANFGAFPASGPPPLTVTFNDLSSNEPTAWAWDFGDGGASTEQHPTHVYSQPGMYDVTLTATNAIGADTLTMPDLITVSEPAAPVAHFTASPRSGPAPLTVTFEDQSAGGPTSWGWDFGDGGASTVRHPQHTYNQTGSYTVTLTAGNAIGSHSLAVPGYITVVEVKKIYLPLVVRSAR